jgi:hypothetical protein
MYVYLQGCWSAFYIIVRGAADARWPWSPSPRRPLLRLHRTHTEEVSVTPHSRTEKKGRSLRRWASTERENVEESWAAHMWVRVRVSWRRGHGGARKGETALPGPGRAGGLAADGARAASLGFACAGTPMAARQSDRPPEPRREGGGRSYGWLDG